MRILLISFWFPPTNAIGAVRAGKFAKYLTETGHDVRVIAGPKLGSLTLPLEVTAEQVIRPVAGNAADSRAALPPPAASVATRLLRAIGPSDWPAAARFEAALKRQYYALLHLPDRYHAWRRPAIAAGRRLLESWRPDLILASSPPVTGLLVAASLSRAAGIPWIAELRDPWFDDPYGVDPVWRRALDRRLEWRTLRRADAIVAVSPPIAADLERRFAKPTAVILNGYAQEDLMPPPPRPPGSPLTIVYTGTIYAGLRDPSALFAALALLGERRVQVRLVFYGAEPATLASLAARHGVQDCVCVHPAVPYRQSLALQQTADVLLLLTHATDAVGIPGKLFEYLGARRPILLLGCAHGVVAGMIRDRDAGLVANDPAVLAAQLGRWLDQLPNGIPALSISARQGLSRTEQFSAYVAFLQTRLRP